MLRGVRSVGTTDLDRHVHSSHTQPDWNSRLSPFPFGTVFFHNLPQKEIHRL
jgi:hypothetical protein